MLEKFQHAENNFENFKHAVGKSNVVKENLKMRNKINMRQIPIYLWQGRVVYSLMYTTFLCRTYHWSACPGELDEAKLLTFHYTFFSFFFLLGAEGRGSGWGSGAQSACPSLSC